jgi:geranylgeranyl diphosphate synthase type II
VSETSTPTFASFEVVLQEQQRSVEDALREHAPRDAPPEVLEAVNACLFAPGERLRPILALLVADVLGGDARSVLPAACAIEMAHTASRILDELPAFDDARRGRPARRAGSDATAILAACALLGRAFEVLAAGWRGGPEALARCETAADLARAVGPGAIGAGQATRELTHSRTTGDLFTVAAALGARAAGAAPWAQRAVTSYATGLGLACRIVDDLIDATPDADEKGARQLAADLAGSQESLQAFGSAAQPLRDLARYVVARRR